MYKGIVVECVIVWLVIERLWRVIWSRWKLCLGFLHSCGCVVDRQIHGNVIRGSISFDLRGYGFLGVDSGEEEFACKVVKVFAKVAVLCNGVNGAYCFLSVDLG